MIDVRTALSEVVLAERLVRLGFRDEDAVDAMAAAAQVRRRPRDLAVVERSAELLAAGVGQFHPDAAPDPWDELPEGREDLALLALLASLDAVRAEHLRRRVPDEVSWRSLGDLGQQVHVNRRTHQAFRLDTYGWMRTAWSGGLMWLGRLQMVPKPTTSGWVLDTHIPATGPLTPDAVDDAFALAVPFFRRHFPEFPPRSFACTSWLLDPQLGDVLPAESNMARFQRRWELAGSGYEADESVVYFVFSRRSPVDLSTLPRRTTLERAVLDHLAGGGHWRAWSGTTPLPTALPTAVEEILL